MYSEAKSIGVRPRAGLHPPSLLTLHQLDALCVGVISCWDPSALNLQPSSLGPLCIASGIEAGWVTLASQLAYRSRLWA